MGTEGPQQIPIFTFRLWSLMHDSIDQQLFPHRGEGSLELIPWESSLMGPAAIAMKGPTINTLSLKILPTS